MSDKLFYFWYTTCCCVRGYMSVILVCFFYHCFVLFALMKRAEKSLESLTLYKNWLPCRLKNSIEKVWSPVFLFLYLKIHKLDIFISTYNLLNFTGVIVIKFYHWFHNLSSTKVIYLNPWSMAKAWTVTLDDFPIWGKFTQLYYQRILVI